MMILVLRRLRIQKGQIWWQNRQAELVPAVFAYLEGESFEVALGRVVEPADIRPLQEIASNLATTVWGDSRDKLIALLIEVGGIAANAQLLRTGKEWERFQAVRNLSLYVNDEVKALLRNVLDDPSTQIRILAAKVLIEMGEKISIEDFTDKVFAGGAVKSVALRDIFRSIAPGQTAALRQTLSAEIKEPVRLLVIDALGSVRDLQAIPVILDQCASASIDVRAEAMRALIAIGHPDVASAVLDGLDDPAWEVRAQAAVGAGQIGIDESVSKLANLLDDSEWWVRYRAAESLKKIGDKGHEILVSAAGGGSRAAAISELVLHQESA